LPAQEIIRLGKEFPAVAKLLFMESVGMTGELLQLKTDL